jgi:two-component system NtrC family sensor kinase
VDEGGTVTLTVKPMRDRVEIRVTDDGCGMTPEVLENLFEPFFTRNRTGKGTGLGLSISHLIVSQHGGSLEAESDGLGRGSTFVVKLPLQPAPALTAA